jgi:hypothetical protein
MDYDFWPNMEELVDDSSSHSAVDSTSLGDFEQDEDYIQTQVLLREMMPDHEEFQSQQTHRIIRPHQQIRTIKMCK